MIALRVADVDALNHLARQRLAAAGALTGPAITAADRAFQTGDRVLARRNRRQPTPDGATVPVMNGQRGIISATNPSTRTVTVNWDGGCATVVPAGYLDAGHLDHGYAITGHRAQGLTVDRTWIHTSDATYREWGYIAASRGRHHNQFYTTNRDGVPFDADELDHGAWQSAGSTAARRLATRLGRTNAHPAAVDQSPSPRPITAPGATTEPEPSDLEQALGID